MSFSPVNDFATKTQLSFRKAHYEDGYLNGCTAIEGTERECGLNKTSSFTIKPVFGNRGRKYPIESVAFSCSLYSDNT